MGGLSPVDSADRPGVAAFGARGGPAVDAEERRARLVLSLAAEPADLALGRLVRERGAAAVLARFRAAGGADVGTTPEHGALARRVLTADPDAAMEDTARCGARVVMPGDPEWPTQLDDLGDTAPLALWLSGAADLRLLALRSVALVGARAATAYGESVARDMAMDLAARGFAVVSGGAYGIDAAAHRGALDAGGVTACVLAGGVDVPYPRAHEALVARIADGGVLVSESPPGTPAYRRRFLSRNRLIAALTRATVVVEAALRSGSTSTAGHARALRRPVLAVPGPVTSPMSAGTHRLIRDGGAVLATGADDVAELAGAIGADAAPVARAPERPLDDLDPDSARIYDALPLRGGASVDALAEDSGIPPRSVLVALALLESAGLARADAGLWCKRRPSC